MTVVLELSDELELPDELLLFESVENVGISGTLNEVDAIDVVDVVDPLGIFGEGILNTLDPLDPLGIFGEGILNTLDPLGPLGIPNILGIFGEDILNAVDPLGIFKLLRFGILNVGIVPTFVVPDVVDDVPGTLLPSKLLKIEGKSVLLIVEQNLIFPSPTSSLPTIEQSSLDAQVVSSNVVQSLGPEHAPSINLLLNKK